MHLFSNSFQELNYNTSFLHYATSPMHLTQLPLKMHTFCSFVEDAVWSFSRYHDLVFKSQCLEHFLNSVIKCDKVNSAYGLNIVVVKMSWGSIYSFLYLKIENPTIELFKQF